MTRSIARWTTALAAAAVFALPLGTAAQTPQPDPQQTPPPAEQPKQAPQPAPAPTEQPKQAPQPAPPPPDPQQPTSPPAEQPSKTQAPQESAQDHLRQAKAALGGIQDSAITGTARTRLAELRRHMTALERASAAPAQPAKPSRSQRRTQAQSWATQVAAIDRIITQMIGTGAATGTTTAPTATGTTGTTGTRGTKAQAAIAIDEATRGKLMEVRTHITAFAAAMSGTQTPPATPNTPAAPSPSTPSTTTQTPAMPDPTAPATRSPTTQTQPTTQTPAQPGTTPASPQRQTAVAGTPDIEASKRHLTAARDTLSELTQLPEAGQLTGDARNQVTQLITNFNELITMQSEWRGSYAKVDANLTTLIGAERTDEANVPPPATGTAGAIGTSGISTLDPKIREKLVEFRRQLSEFQRAVSGGGPAR